MTVGVMVNFPRPEPAAALKNFTAVEVTVRGVAYDTLEFGLMQPLPLHTTPGAALMVEASLGSVSELKSWN